MPTINRDNIDKNQYPDIWDMQSKVDQFIELFLKNHYRLSVPIGYHISGLTLSNNSTDPNNDIDIASGLCSDADQTVIIRLFNSITKRLDAAWNVGTNQGGLFSGTKANNTWYHVFIIRNPTTGEVDAGFDTSIIAANRPSMYTQYQCIMSIRTSNVGNILAFTQIYNSIIYNVAIPDRLDGNIPNTIRNLLTLTAPPGSIAMLEITSGSTTVGAPAFYWIKETFISDYAPTSTDNARLAYGSWSGLYNLFLAVDSLSQIAFRGSSTYVTLSIKTLGFEHPRGRW